MKLNQGHHCQAHVSCLNTLTSMFVAIEHSLLVQRLNEDGNGIAEPEEYIAEDAEVGWDETDDG